MIDAAHSALAAGAGRTVLHLRHGAFPVPTYGLLASTFLVTRADGAARGGNSYTRARFITISRILTGRWLRRASVHHLPVPRRRWKRRRDKTAVKDTYSVCPNSNIAPIRRRARRRAAWSMFKISRNEFLLDPAYQRLLRYPSANASSVHSSWFMLHGH